MRRPPTWFELFREHALNGVVWLAVSLILWWGFYLLMTVGI